MEFNECTLEQELVEKGRTEGHDETVQGKTSFSAYSEEEGSRVVPQKSYMIAIPRNDTVLLAMSLLETTNEIHNNSTASLSSLVRGGFK